MGDILGKLQAVHGARKMVQVGVPEYGMDLYFPPLTIADHEKIRKGVNPKDEHALMISGLIFQARNKDGSQAFDDTAEMRAELHRMELTVMQRIISQASSDLDGDVVAQLAKVDVGLVRVALLSALDDQTSGLAEAVNNAADTELVQTLRALAEAVQARQPLKKG